MDPFSYGYNRATPANAYMNASTIVSSLVDIVSKNGNFLLDVGPQANGTMIQVEQDNLRQGGVWIKDHAEAIFNTTYWFITPEENKGATQIRFTQTLNAFYIISLVQPNGSIILDSPIPWVQGDAVTVLGGNASGVVVPSQRLSNGSILLNISTQVQEADQYAWAFKISFGGQTPNGTSGNTTTATNTTSGSSPTASSTAPISSSSKPIGESTLLVSLAVALLVSLVL